MVLGQPQRLPVRLLRNAVPAGEKLKGVTRTLVLNRVGAGEQEQALRAAEVRFTRFFNSSPMAIAALDANGRVARANGAFGRLFGESVAVGTQTITASAVARTCGSVVAARRPSASAGARSLDGTSAMYERPAASSPTLNGSLSYPVTRKPARANSTTNGRPTYPIPTTTTWP